MREPSQPPKACFGIAVVNFQTEALSGRPIPNVTGVPILVAEFAAAHFLSGKAESNAGLPLGQMRLNTASDGPGSLSAAPPHVLARIEHHLHVLRATVAKIRCSGWPENRKRQPTPTKKEAFGKPAAGYFRLTRAFLRTGFAAPSLVPAIRKSSSFFPDLMAAANHRGFSPRPAQVSLGFSGFRNFGATFPRAPSRSAFGRAPLESKRDSLASSVSRARRSPATFDPRAASILLRRPTSASIDIDFKFIMFFSDETVSALYRTVKNCKPRIAAPCRSPRNILRTFFNRVEIETLEDNPLPAIFVKGRINRKAQWADAWGRRRVSNRFIRLRAPQRIIRVSAR
jgi:hypothetical protein